MSQLKIVREENASSEQWDRIVGGCDYASFYHSRQWAEIWYEYSEGKFKPAARYLTFSDGTEVLFPMSEYRVSGGLLKQYISSPNWTTGGWLSSSTLTPTHHNLIQEYASQFDLILRQNPFDPTLPTSGFTLPLSQNGITQVIELRDNLEQIEDYWNRRMGKHLRKAQRNELTAGITNELKDWKEYYRVYEACLERWGDSLRGKPYSYRLFELMYKLNLPGVKLWVARMNSQIISGVIIFYQNRHVSAWHGAGLKEYFTYNPTLLLDHEITINACRERRWWYDLGSSGGSESLSAYKRRIGAKEYDYNLYINKKLARKFIDSLKTVRNLKPILAKQ